MIYLIPQAGLANRMRVIASGLSLSDKLSQPITILWSNNRDATCDFDDLFQPIGLISVKTKSIRSEKINILINGAYNPKHLSKKWVYSALSRLVSRWIPEVKVTTEYRKILNSNEVPEEMRKPRFFIKDFIAFGKYQEYYELFHPKKELGVQIDNIASTFTSNTIGVHIRRTDFREQGMSPSHLYYEKMDEIISQDDTTNFYLCSDSPAEKKALVERYGDRILTYFEDTSRGNKNGMQQAVIDLYTLSRTSKLLGAYWSSFSGTAARIGNIPLIPIGKPDSK